MGFESPHGVAGISILTVGGAQAALRVLDLALETVSKSRAQLGAIQNALSYHIQNMSTNVINTEAARSRIMDTDYAAETAELARRMIGQQILQAMLAQANTSSKQVLSLLQ